MLPHCTFCLTRRCPSRQTTSFSFYSHPHPPNLHSFPTRRSSDLSISLGTPYSGPVAGLVYQYINVTSDSLNVTALSPNGFIQDRKSTRLNSSHITISYAVFCLKKKKINCDDIFTTAILNVSSSMD